MVFKDKQNDVLQVNENENQIRRCLTGETYTKTNYEDKKWFWEAIKKVREDEFYRQKWIYTISIYSAFFTLGILKTQFGPTFLDLLMIADIDLDDGSWIVTAFYIGYICGSVMSGAVYKKINPVLFILLALILLGVVIALIPWCFLLELMLLAHGVKGIGAGILDAIAIAELVRVWKANANKYLIGLNLVFSIGGVLSPLITAPFLKEVNNEDSFAPTNISSLNTYNTNQSVVYNMDPSVSNASGSGNTDRQNTKLYLAYLITTALCLTDAFIFLALFFVQKGKDKTVSYQGKALSGTVRPLPLAVRICVFIVTGLMLTIFSAIDESILSYLSAYCVEHFSWSKKDAAFVTSVASISVMVSRSLSIFTARFIDSRVFVGTLSVILFADFLGFTVISIYKIDIGVWIFSGLFGFAKSILFPLTIGLTNEYFFPVTGFVSAFYMTIGKIGSALNPLILGYVMEHIAQIAFSYLFFIESFIVLILVLIEIILSRYVVKKHGVTYSNTKEIDVSETEGY